MALAFWPISDRTKGYQSLNAQLGVGIGAALSVAGALKFGLQCIVAGSPAACVVTLEGTIDGVTWFILLTWDITTPQNSGDILFAVDKPVAQIRAHCTSISAGAGKTVSAYLSAA